MRNLFKLYRNLKQFTTLIIVGVALMYLSVRANLELPTLMSNIVDKGIIASDIGYIWKEGGIMLLVLSLIHISEPTRLGMISYAVFCLKKKKIEHPRGRLVQ